MSDINISSACAQANAPLASVQAHSHVTLHYRLRLDGRTVADTFAATPATLQIGQGQLAPLLEERLLGLPEATRRTFVLNASEAYGERNPDLLRPLSLNLLRQHAAPGETFQVGDLVELPAPPELGTRKITGQIQALDDTHAMLDFNHPLAGHALEFEVQVIGVLND